MVDFVPPPDFDPTEFTENPQIIRKLAKLRTDLEERGYDSARIEVVVNQQRRSLLMKLLEE